MVPGPLGLSSSKTIGKANAPDLGHTRPKTQGRAPAWVPPPGTRTVHQPPATTDRTPLLRPHAHAHSPEARPLAPAPPRPRLPSFR